MHCVPQLQPEKGNPGVQGELPQPVRGSSVPLAVGTAGSRGSPTPGAIGGLSAPQVTNVQPSQVGPCPAHSCPSWGLGPAFQGFIPNPLGWVLARALCERFQRLCSEL